MKALLTVSYDGTDYCGWQRQDGQITVQQVIEEALSKLYLTNVKILGASRTDSGVHALGQKATFSPPDERLPFDRICLALNTMLPKDIRITQSEAVNDDFHVINDVTQKTYQYRIQNRAVYDPILFRYAHHIKEHLCLSLMNEASRHFIGEHDFKAFCASHSGAVTTVRTVYNLSVSAEDEQISITICGSGFLYNMVRIIAGTLVEVGMGKTEPSQVASIIESRSRKHAGITLPAKGLTLLKITY